MKLNKLHIISSRKWSVVGFVGCYCHNILALRGFTGKVFLPSTEARQAVYHRQLWLYPRLAGPRMQRRDRLAFYLQQNTGINICTYGLTHAFRDQHIHDFLHVRYRVSDISTPNCTTGARPFVLFSSSIYNIIDSNLIYLPQFVRFLPFLTISSISAKIAWRLIPGFEEAYFKQSTRIIAILAKFMTHQQHLGHLSSCNGHRAGMVKSSPRVQEITDVIWGPRVIQFLISE